jgi:hypothetical protein
MRRVKVGSFHENINFLRWLPGKQGTADHHCCEMSGIRDVLDESEAHGLWRPAKIAVESIILTAGLGVTT